MVRSVELSSLIILAAIIFGSIPMRVRAQTWSSHTSPRSLGLSGANVAAPRDGRDANPALLPDTSFDLGIDFMPFPSGLEDSWTAGAAADDPIDEQNSIGVSYDKFQYGSIYSSESFAAQYSRAFGNERTNDARSTNGTDSIEHSETTPTLKGASAHNNDALAVAGVRLRYSSDTYGDGQYYYPLDEISVDVGAVLRLATQLSLGVAIDDLATLYRSQDIGTDVRSAALGLTYRPIGELALHAAIESMTGSPLDVLGGIEYDLEPSITLRVGIESLTDNFSGGVGLHYDAFLIDFSVVRHPILGDELSFGVITKL
ncbi:MAG TPA: hypothetical protein VG537_04205 [Candidatus Kapabacteria bacterium]|nr:hypothetical protein [Candidatus Kapabacteria bacterium]